MDGEQPSSSETSGEQFRQELAAINGGAGSFQGAIGTLLDYMSDTPSPLASDRRWQWAEDDHDVLSCVVDLEQKYQPLLIPRLRPFFGPDEPVPPIRQRDTGREIARCMARYHAALPFEVAEREVLLQVCDYNLPLGEVEGRIEAFESTVVSGGVRRVVQGRDLMRRWWSWRRQTDEFAGQGSHEIAQQALRDAGHLLCLLAEGRDPSAGVPSADPDK